MKSYLTYSAKETKEVAKQVAKNFTSGVIALIGEMGSGKTTFVQGFAEGLRIKDKIISPTFVLIRQHPIPKKGLILYHIDLYRLEDQNDVKNLGINDLLKNPKNIVLIEWAEKAKDLLPNFKTKIKFEIIDQISRKIIVT
mgnify:CR=1 FL=1